MGAALVEHDTVAAEHHREEVAVAAHPAQGVHGQGNTVAGLAHRCVGTIGGGARLAAGTAPVVRQQIGVGLATGAGELTVALSDPNVEGMQPRLDTSALPHEYVEVVTLARRHVAGDEAVEDLLDLGHGAQRREGQ